MLPNDYYERRAVQNVVEKWEAWQMRMDEDAKLYYAAAVDLLFKLGHKERLIEGYEHNGWRVFIDTQAVGMPLKLVRMQ